MLEKVILKDKVGYFQNSYSSDPLLQKIKWYPLSNESATFRKYKLDESDSQRMKFKSTFRGMFSPILFILFALSIIIFILLLADIPLSELLSVSSLSFDNDNIGIIIWVLIGFIMIIVGILMLYFGTMPRYFDKTKGLFWRGRKIPNKTQKKKIAELKDIHSIQILSKRTRTSRTTSGASYRYTSYELNLILHTGRRLHIVCHGKKEAMKSDALKLSQFLKKPVWDSTK